MHSLVLVPNKVSELQLRIFITIFNMSKTLMLIDLIVISFIVLLLLVILLLLTFNKLALESFNHCEEINTVSAENSKFSVVNWVELNLLIILWLAWQLHIRLNRKFFVLFDIENGYAEVRDPAYHEQVAAVPRESHIKHLDRCVGLEPGDQLLAGVPKDVHLWIQSIVSCRDEVLVIVAHCEAEAIALRPI
jgi:hypothetical protein